MRENPLYETYRSLAGWEGAKYAWETLPLLEHFVVPALPEDEAFLQQALEYLLVHHEKIAAEKLELLKALAFVELREEQKGQATSITSASFPALPFCSFFSRKAFAPNCYS